MRNGRLGVVIGDVCGHGLGPALGMALVHAYLRALAQTLDTPGEILCQANRNVCQEMESGWFATVSLCQLDPQTRSLMYAGAGHESYLFDTSGEVTALRASGLPLGIDADKAITGSPAIELQAGQLVLLLSDGITESESTDGNPFGLAGATDVVRAHRHESAREIVTALCQAAQHHARPASQTDDITAVVIKVT
jgi:phosphoserine phosphatase RsbU/P